MQKNILIGNAQWMTTLEKIFLILKNIAMSLANSAQKGKFNISFPIRTIEMPDKNRANSK